MTLFSLSLSTWSLNFRSTIFLPFLSLFAAVVLASGAAVLLPVEAFGADNRSQEIFKDFCAQCHGPRGGGNPKIGAPAISGLPSWYVTTQLNKFRDGIRGTHPKDEAGMRMSPMARYLRDGSDLADVAQYVSSLPAQPQVRTIQGSSLKGEATFRTCAACHGADGKGNQATNGPKLVGASDWYLLKQLKNFKEGLRGGDMGKDPIGGSMRAISMTLDEAAMKDVVSYIATMSP